MLGPKDFEELAQTHKNYNSLWKRLFFPKYIDHFFEVYRNTPSPIQKKLIVIRILEYTEKLWFFQKWFFRSFNDFSQSKLFIYFQLSKNYEWGQRSFESLLAASFIEQEDEDAGEENLIDVAIGFGKDANALLSSLTKIACLLRRDFLPSIPLNENFLLTKENCLYAFHRPLEKDSLAILSESLEILHWQCLLFPYYKPPTAEMTFHSLLRAYKRPFFLDVLKQIANQNLLICKNGPNNFESFVQAGDEYGYRLHNIILDAMTRIQNIQTQHPITAETYLIALRHPKICEISQIIQVLERYCMFNGDVLHALLYRNDINLSKISDYLYLTGKEEQKTASGLANVTRMVGILLSRSTEFGNEEQSQDNQNLASTICSTANFAKFFAITTDNVGKDSLENLSVKATP